MPLFGGQVLKIGRGIKRGFIQDVFNLGKNLIPYFHSYFLKKMNTNSCRKTANRIQKHLKYVYIYKSAKGIFISSKHYYFLRFELL